VVIPLLAGGDTTTGWYAGGDTTIGWYGGDRALGPTTTGQVVTMYHYLVHMVPALPINKLNAVPGT